MEVKAHSGFHDLFRKYTTPSEDIITGGKHRSFVYKAKEGRFVRIINI
jgi:hypothetical protein